MMYLQVFLDAVDCSGYCLGGINGIGNNADDGQRESSTCDGEELLTWAQLKSKTVFEIVVNTILTQSYGCCTIA